MKEKIKSFLIRYKIEKRQMNEYHKNYPSVPLHNKVYKFILIFTLVAYIAFAFIICSVNASAAEETNVIKAGTYRFIDDMQPGPSNTNVAINLSIPFTYSFNVYDVDYTAECSSIRYYLTYLAFYADSATPSLDDLGYDVPGYINSAVNNNWYTGTQDITVLRDTVVSDSVAYSWFTDNTIPLDVDNDFVISSGTYEFARFTPNSLDVGQYYEYLGTFYFENQSYDGLKISYETVDDLNIYGLSRSSNQWVELGSYTDPNDIIAFKKIYIPYSITVDSEAAYNVFNETVLPSSDSDPLYAAGFFVAGIFSALDEFILFPNFSLLDLIFSLIGIFSAMWFLKVLAGG